MDRRYGTLILGLFCKSEAPVFVPLVLDENMRSVSGPGRSDSIGKAPVILRQENRWHPDLYENKNILCVPEIKFWFWVSLSAAEVMRKE
jgi:hypothetical protein